MRDSVFGTVLVPAPAGDLNLQKIRVVILSHVTRNTAAPAPMTDAAPRDAVKIILLGDSAVGKSKYAP